METACWSLASWKEGLELDLRGKLPTAAGGWPGAGPGQPGAGGAARKTNRAFRLGLRNCIHPVKEKREGKCSQF